MPPTIKAIFFGGRNLIELTWIYSLKNDSDDARIAPGVAESPRRVSGCGSDSEGTHDGLRGLERKTGRELMSVQAMRFKKTIFGVCVFQLLWRVDRVLWVVLW
jgi:hypothetical protein